MKLEPGWPKMEPEFTKNGCNIEKNALNRPKWLPDSSQDHFGSMMSTSLGGFLGPLGVPKIDQKSILGPKRGARKRFFIDFSREQRLSHFWAWFFHRFLMIFWSKNRCIFPKPRAIFSTWRWPKSMHRRSVLSTFYLFFYFFEICENMTQKTKHNRWSKKTSKNRSQGVPEFTPNGS